MLIFVLWLCLYLLGMYYANCEQSVIVSMHYQSNRYINSIPSLSLADLINWAYGRSFMHIHIGSAAGP